MNEIFIAAITVCNRSLSDYNLSFILTYKQENIYEISKSNFTEQ